MQRHLPSLTPALTSWELGATAKHGVRFDRRNTVIVGDSPSDVQTGLEGGARVIAVASGKSSPKELRNAGAPAVLDDLVDTHRPNKSGE